MKRHIKKTQRIETLLDEKTVQKLDGWRSTQTPRPSRSEAVRLLLEQHLSDGKRQKQTEQTSLLQYPSVDRLGALFALESVPGFGPVKFRAMHDAGVNPKAAIDNPDLLPFAGKTGVKLRAAIRNLPRPNLESARQRATQQLMRARTTQHLFWSMVTQCTQSACMTAIIPYLSSMCVETQRYGRTQAR